MDRRIVMAHGHLGDDEATRLCAQLLTLDAEGDDPLERRTWTPICGRAHHHGVLDVVGHRPGPRGRSDHRSGGVGVLAASSERDAYPNAMFALSEPMTKFDGTPVAIAAREEQPGGCRLALLPAREVTGAS